jgi:dUTP pyrophosphatase
MLNLKIKRLSKTAKLPTKAHSNDACFDIYANIEECVFGCTNLIIPPHTTVKIPTGFATEIPHGYWAAIFARSGLASKQGLRPSNCVAVIDEGYRNEWLLPMYNDSDKDQIIHHGDRVMQFTLLPYYDTELTEVDELNTTERGLGGFGSSGTN